MAKRIQLRRGTTAQINAFTGAVGEVSVDTDKDVLVVHDGVTAGGFPVAARANADGTISLIKKDGTVVGLINSAGLFNNTLTSTNTDQAPTAAIASKLHYGITNSIGGGVNGVGYQNYVSSRAMDTTYTVTETTLVHVVATLSNAGAYLAPIIITGSLGIVASSGGAPSTGGRVSMTFVIPKGSQYYLSISAGTATLITWMEYKGVN